MKIGHVIGSITLVLCLIFQCSDGGPNRALSRRKRYINFPEGAAISLAFCMTAQLWVYPPGIFTESIAWGLGYDLPNDTRALKSFFPKPMTKRRQRRDLYGKMEKIMDSMGYDGRSCILRTLCEISRKMYSKQNNVIELILKIVFGFPAESVERSEPDEHRIYHWASQIGHENTECSDIFKNCPFSLIDMALGMYSPSFMPE